MFQRQGIPGRTSKGRDGARNNNTDSNKSEELRARKQQWLRSNPAGDTPKEIDARGKNVVEAAAHCRRMITNESGTRGWKRKNIVGLRADDGHVGVKM